MKTLLKIIVVTCITGSVFALFYHQDTLKSLSVFKNYEVGDTLDIYENVVVYYNGSTGNVSGRNTTEDGYNLGLKYQCVEFVKRFYYERYNHKMPNSYGHAKDFFNKSIDDAELNPDRDLLQFKHPSVNIPKVGDLIVFDASIFNAYGHVAIVAHVGKDEIEIVQQNTGTQSRSTYPMNFENEKYTIGAVGILGYLRRE